MDTEVKIKKSEYEWILDQSVKLKYLQEAGVAGWHGYESALREYNAINKRKELLSNFMDELNQVIAEGNLSHPAGYGCGHQIDIDEDFVISLVNNLIKEIKELDNE